MPEAHSVAARGPGLLGRMEQAWLHLPVEVTGSGRGTGEVGDMSARRGGRTGWKGGREGSLRRRCSGETNTVLGGQGRGRRAGGGPGENGLEGPGPVTKEQLREA